MDKIITAALMLFAVFAVRCHSTGPDDSVHPDLDVRGDYLQETVEFLAMIRPFRNFMYPSSMDRAADYIEQRFQKYGLQTQRQYFEVDGKKYGNVLATLNADKPERIVIGAHYDVCADQPGADDNASGVAGLLEIARLLTILGRSSKYRFDFAAYALEEPPFFATRNMGSYVHAESLFTAKAHIKGMICLESIGYFSDKEKTQQYPLGIMKLFYPKTGDFIAVVGNSKSGKFLKEVKKHMQTASIGVECLKSPAILPGANFSDHRNYWTFGYPAVMITDTALYRNPNYHQTTDTIDTLDFVKMQEVVKGITWALLNL